MSSYIKELWYNETVDLWMTIYIYIYIYIYIIYIYIIKIRRNIDESDACKEFRSDISFFIQHFLQIWIQNKVQTHIGLHVNAHKTEYMCFNQSRDTSTLNGSSLKLVDKFTYRRSSVLSTETNINTWLAKACIAIDSLSVIRKSELTDKMKQSVFQAAVVSILLFGCTTFVLTKRMEKKLDGNYTRMQRAILIKFWR